MSTDVDFSTTDRASAREWAGLLILALPTLLISIDMSVFFLAIPHIAIDLTPSPSQELWILDIYGFVTATFLIPMGTIGDRFGRRRVLLVGAAGFGAASLVAAFAPTAEVLILARALLGLFAATFAPSAMALLQQMFRDPVQRTIAIGVWMSCFMGGAVLGPLVGGALLSTFWWGSMFLLAVPVVLVTLVLGRELLPEQSAPQPGRLDVISVPLMLLAMLPFIYGVTEIAREGWEPAPALVTAVGLAFGAVFVRRQRRVAQPLFQVSLLRNPVFRSIVALALLGGLIQGGGLLVVSLELQIGRGLSALAAGLWLIIPGVAMVVGTMLGSGLARTFRPATVMLVGQAIAAIGYLVLTQEPSGGLTAVVVGFTLVLGGMGPAVALGYEIMMGVTAPEKTASASASVETSGQVGVALGIAVLGTIATVVYRSVVDLPASITDSAAGESLSGAVETASRLPSPLSDHVMSAAEAAFGTSFVVVALVGAALLLVLMAIVATTLRAIPAIGAQPPLASMPASEEESDARANDSIADSGRLSGRSSTVVLSRPSDDRSTPLPDECPEQPSR